MKIIGIVGPAGSGKDTAADVFVEAGWCKIALADELKRTLKRWYGFSEEQLWGPSERRSEIDERIGFSPRQALQTLGTGVGRLIHKDTWIDILIRTAYRALDRPEHGCRWFYDRAFDGGLYSRYNIAAPLGVVVPDVRYKNEADVLRRHGGKILRISRHQVETDRPFGPQDLPAFRSHSSETEQVEIVADHEIDNCGSIEDLHRAVTAFMNELPLRDVGWGPS